MSNFTRNFPLLFVMIFGVLLRIIWGLLPGFKIDTDTWFAWSNRLVDLGLSNFYSDQIWTNYTPGYLYVLYLLGLIKNLFNLTPEVYLFVLKLPAITAEILLGIFIYKFMKKTVSEKVALFASSFVFLNPAFIFNSSVWGQIDSILTSFLFLSVYFLYKTKLVYSSAFLGISLLIKPQASALLPLFIIYLISNFSLKSFLKIILPGLTLILIISFPFFTSNPFFGFINLVSNMSNDYKNISVFAYNIWGIFGFWIEDSRKLFLLTYQQWGIIFYLIYWVIIFWLHLKKRFSLFSLSVLAALSFYFLPTRVHERYLYPALLLLIVTAYRSKLFLPLFAGLNFLHILNLYYVYVYYNELFLNLPKLLYFAPLYNFLDSNMRFLSLISTIIFALLNYIMIVSRHGNHEVY